METKVVEVEQTEEVVIELNVEQLTQVAGGMGIIFTD